MIFGLLLIIVILYGFLLFWVLQERLKGLAYTMRKTNDTLKRTEEQLTLIVNLVGGERDNRNGESIKERFTPDILTNDDEGHIIQEGDH